MTKKGVPLSMMTRKSRNIPDISSSIPLSVLTCYTFPFAKILEKTNLDAVLVGDSLSEVLYGFSSTREVTLEMMKLHVSAVRKGFLRHLIADLPYATYDDEISALKNSKQLIEVGADSVKLENPKTSVVERLHSEKIIVWGHIGLTPQTMTHYRKVGKTPEEREQLITDAKRLEQAGCCGLFLEAIPSEVAKEITDYLTIPTIGIASGKECGGQVMVHDDILGMTGEKKNYFFHYENLDKEVLRISNDYIKKVVQK